MTRKELEKAASEIDDVRLARELRELQDEGLRSAISLYRRRKGVKHDD
jgi:hypothetical protein